MVDQPGFGQRVRQARRLRGMSQAEIAGAEMSASYVSLVESGRRTPSAELARTIADRLGMPLAALLAPDPDDRRREHRLGMAGRLITARHARDNGDHDLAHQELRSMIEQGFAPEDEDIAWETRWELAETLDRLGERGAREQVLCGLSEDPLTSTSALLSTRVKTARSELARWGGALGDSLQLAQEAVAVADPLDAPSADRVHAGLALVCAYAEAGEWSRAQSTAADLMDTVDLIAYRQLQSQVLWTCASALFFAGHPEKSVDLLDQALANVRPATNVRLWGRLHTAAAALRIAVGDVAGAQPLLARARQAVDLLGDPSEHTRLAAVESSGHLRRGDAVAASEAASRIDVTASGLSAQDGTRCLVVVARIEAGTGNPESAVTTFRRAASRYEEAGAYRLAAETWREVSETTAGATTHAPTPDHHALVLP